ncbi:MAG TPA: hypothetical protein VKB45_01960 [Gemmatimonadales bacterium]|nr:hypothetical protein [Gemmatimonadales bacterium]
MTFTEPGRATALRTGSIALAIGIGVTLARRQLSLLPVVTLMALWFTLGGHYVELLFRNRLAPVVDGSPQRLALVRLPYWFVGGSLLYAAALATRDILVGRGHMSSPWWMGGALFVVAELLIHLVMRARGQPSFYDGRG